MVHVVAREGLIVSLDQLHPGQSAEVVRILSGESGRLLKLSALGLAPGSRLCLQQCSPAYIVWVGETQVSLDGDVACEILVRVGRESGL